MQTARAMPRAPRRHARLRRFLDNCGACEGALWSSEACDALEAFVLGFAARVGENARGMPARQLGLAHVMAATYGALPRAEHAGVAAAVRAAQTDA